MTALTYYLTDAGGALIGYMLCGLLTRNRIAEERERCARIVSEMVEDYADEEAMVERVMRRLPDSRSDGRKLLDDISDALHAERPGERVGV